MRKFIGKAPEEQQALLKEPLFMSLYQASFIGFQYTCFNCIAVCPVREKHWERRQLHEFSENHR